MRVAGEGKIWDNFLMKKKSHLYHRHRFPRLDYQLYCIWLYNSFSSATLDVEKIMLCRGVCVTYEAIRYWCRKFSLTFGVKFVVVAQRRGESGIWTKCAWRLISEVNWSVAIRG